MESAFLNSIGKGISRRILLKRISLKQSEEVAFIYLDLDRA
jgi:hypothetical protein